MSTLVKRLLAALVIVLLLIAMNQYMSEEGLFGFGVPPYYARVIMLAGINIILAVSLNLITGFTGQFSIGHAGFMAVGAFVIITIVIVYNIVHSDIGRALVSIREDELAAEAMGINTTRYKVLAFVISSALAGVAGVLFGHYTQFLSTNDFQFIRSFEVIIMIVLGGMGSLTGSVLGAIVITVLPELLRQLPGDLSRYRLVVYSALLILIMLTRPQGILGTREFSLSWLKRSRKRPEGA